MVPVPISYFLGLGGLVLPLPVIDCDQATWWDESRNFGLCVVYIQKGGATLLVQCLVT